jgi:trehalose 6-phosphate synthase
MAHDEPNLIVVSNRLPVRVTGSAKRGWTVRPSSGGLVTALDPVFRSRRGAWIGWPGTSTDDAGLVQRLAAESEGRNYRLLPILLRADEVRGFYRGFSNEIIWPLFHDLITKCNFDPRYWQTYREVNDRFAKVVADVAEPDDLIWVHDYHLMGVAARLRALGVDNRVGFFSHIPFPEPDIFRRLPWSPEILDSLLDYDLLGFQLARDAHHFTESLRQMIASAQSKNWKRTGTGGARRPARRKRDRNPRVDHFPISIDFDEFAGCAAQDDVQAMSAGFRQRIQGRCMVLGVDRLDYSKGLPHKLAAFRYALEQYPQLRGEITLVQHVVPSREKIRQYARLRSQVQRIVGEINGTFGRLDWTPVHYFYGSLNRAELCAYYSAANICLVTPLKDGMNLVAKEYCAAQLDETGLLILSEFAGAAEELGPDALLVNPFDVQELAAAIYCGFTIQKPERRARMKRLRAQLRSHSVHRWAADYLRALSAPPDEEARRVFTDADAKEARLIA